MEMELQTRQAARSAREWDKSRRQGPTEGREGKRRGQPSRGWRERKWRGGKGERGVKERERELRRDGETEREMERRCRGKGGQAEVQRCAIQGFSPALYPLCLALCCSC